ncbi:MULTISPECIES: aminotransferase class I/II-fold pyridoxal phosphate-dependent enzyme [unclassified Hydrogenobaculum]|uniref:aminotransferase class I/II-fold pyridoxal phosphate-dependent enzyme n=1 Tax=unclassified Hydrogenobaculum TaxID=2622382 RepID=UPI0001C51078|nr:MULTISPECIES: aminotransferase class I/II-fold pyridoxal phosphate-dependent enzyme [unclassified Hydrogenobaculum]AEF18953.1 LL-diaminopimelate aminotransferase [Hydrogenobaculum sp. 3684]AEG46240.1 LL-diaminopimelate aminotransferase [Hydrogenobaculum sp. SHO]AGG14885.1 aminotransferase class I and II [Hydrogenobaculum sp. HO]AGH93181.1 aspartate/tyrosine/aromatic aminotransferase [Hydrogenobaculum sp. SN]
MDNWMFPRIKSLPPYVFAVVNELKTNMRKNNEDVIDLGMGNPDLPPNQEVIEKLCETAKKPNVHGYSASKGIPGLRRAIASFYKKRYGVDLDKDREVVMTMGAKEGYSHLMLAMLSPGDSIVVSNPTYPIHYYAPIISGGNVISINIEEPDSEDFENKYLENLFNLVKNSLKKPVAIVLSFPHNPTTATVSLEFFKEVVAFAKSKGIWLIHDFAYADLGFDGYNPPSILQVEGAKDIAVELYSMSKGFSMAGWRVAFMVGNEILVKNLVHLKSYLDYGLFTPIQVASIKALDGDYSFVEKNRDIYKKRRDVLVKGLNDMGWHVKPPKAGMFVWAKIPSSINMNSLDFSMYLLKEAKVAVSPGVGFGEMGEGYVRFALVENEKRIRQAIKNMKKVLSHQLKLSA